MTRAVDEPKKRFIVETGLTNIEPQGTPTVRVTDTQTGTEYQFYNTSRGHFAAIRQGDSILPMESDEAWAELNKNAKG